MRNKRYLFPIALLISLLIILIPIAVATEIETYDNLILKTSEQRIDLYQSPGETEGLSDPGRACVEQHEETSSFADSLDNSVISTLEKIASVLFAICTTMSAIDTVISAVSIAIGMISGACCIGAPEPSSIARCTAAEIKFRAWSEIYSIAKPLCCFVSCGWCTGTDCFSILGIDLGSISLGAIPNIGIAGPGSGIAQFGLSPYDNIYTAIGCLCPIAIIFNMRKLKTIYDVYDCCIQEACENGLSTEACERQLDEATCIYWEGSLYSILGSLLLSILASFIAKKLLELFDLSKLLACVYAALKIVQVPRVIENVRSAWRYMTRTFDEPNCDDLGFDRIKEQSEAAMAEAAEEGFEDIEEELLENWEYVTLVDKDNDGTYDYKAPVWVKTSEDTYTTTRRMDDNSIKTYTKTKESGKILATITDEKGNKVSTLEWQKIIGSSAPALATLNFKKEGKKIELPYEFGKDIRIDDINFEESTANFIIVNQKGDRFDAYEITTIGNSKLISKRTGAQYIMTEEIEGRQPAGGEIKDYIISSGGKETLIKADSMDSLLEVTSFKDIKSLNEDNIKFLQSAYQKFGEDNIKNVQPYIVNNELISLTVKDEKTKTYETLDTSGVYEKIKDGKTITYEVSPESILSDAGLIVKGKDIKLDDKNKFDPLTSDFETATIINKDGTIKQTQSKLKTNQLITTEFGDKGKLGKVTVIDTKSSYTLTLDNENNLKISDNAKYDTTKNKLQIQTEKGWVDYEDADFKDKALALKYALPETQKEAIEEASEGDLWELLEEKRPEIKEEMDKIANNAKEVVNKVKGAEYQAKKAEETKETRKLTPKESQNQVEYNLMYGMVWTLMDLILREPINDFVKDKCEEDYEASYPPSEKPTESGGGGAGNETTCEDSNINTYNAQFIEKTEIPPNCEYKVSYSIKVCNSSIDYTVFFAGTGNNETIETGTLDSGQIISRNRIIESSICTHETICIKASDGHDQCYPPLPHGG